MTGQQIIDHANYLVDDEIEATRALILVNQAYDRLLTKRFWRFLMTSDTSKTVLANTSTYALPADFLYPGPIRFYNATTGEYSKEFKPIHFNERRKYNKMDGYYFVTLAASNTFTFTNFPAQYLGWTIEMDYGYQPDQLTVSTTPIFNRAFHPLVALEVARYHWYNDQDEKDRSWDKELKKEYDEMFFDMVQWDGRLDVGTAPEIPADPWVDLDE